MEEGKVQEEELDVLRLIYAIDIVNPMCYAKRKGEWKL
jgi:hypothetical protein